MSRDAYSWSRCYSPALHFNLNLSPHLNLKDFFYCIYTFLKCILKAFPFPKPKNLNWITVSFKLLHVGDASNDLWERIVINISQMWEKATARPAACSARVGGSFDQQPSFILETSNWKER